MNAAEVSMIRKITFCTLCAVVAAGCATDYDVIIRGGTVYDHSGNMEPSRVESASL